MRKDQKQHKVAAYEDHARDRAFNRLGIRLTRKALEELKGQILHKKDATKLINQGKEREVWLVKLSSGQAVNAVYDLAMHTVVSFLTEDMLEAVYGNLPDYVNVRQGTNPFVKLTRAADRPVEPVVGQRKKDEEVDFEWPPRVDKKI